MIQQKKPEKELVNRLDSAIMKESTKLLEENTGTDIFKQQINKWIGCLMKDTTKFYTLKVKKLSILWGPLIKLEYLKNTSGTFVIDMNSDYFNFDLSIFRKMGYDQPNIINYDTYVE